MLKKIRFIQLINHFFSFFKQILSIYHYFFIIMEKKYNEKPKKCSNSIKNIILFSLAFHQINFIYVYYVYFSDYSEVQFRTFPNMLYFK